MSIISRFGVFFISCRNYSWYVWFFKGKNEIVSKGVISQINYPYAERIDWSEQRSILGYPVTNNSPTNKTRKQNVVNKYYEKCISY